MVFPPFAGCTCIVTQEPRRPPARLDILSCVTHASAGLIVTLLAALLASCVEHMVMDCYSFTIAFTGVFLEGLEVAFIVISFGSGRGRFGAVAAAAGVAFVVVAVTGALVHRPLSRVPENTMKFAVGVMLT